MNEKSDFLIWAHKRVPNACVVKQFRGLENAWQLKECIPRAEGFPDDVTFGMDPDRPYDTLLTDSLKNIERLIVASRRLAEFFQARPLNHVEYLPVSILDHRGRVAAPDYFVIHPVEPVECLDAVKSNADWSSLNEGTIDSVERLVIDSSKVDASRELFRMRFFFDLIIVRRGLAESINAMNFTGVRWIELSDYPEV